MAKSIETSWSNIYHYYTIELTVDVKQRMINFHVWSIYLRKKKERKKEQQQQQQQEEQYLSHSPIQINVHVREL